MTVDLWSGLFIAIVSLPILVVLVAAIRSNSSRWPWWGPAALLLGWAFAVGSVVSRLDDLGERGSLSAHVAQHLLLGDFAAPLILLGLLPLLGHSLQRGQARLTASSFPGQRALLLALSPAGALILWATATYIWLVPPLHRLAVPDGFVNLIDHLSFLFFGLLIWLGAFDFRRGQRVSNWSTLKHSLTSHDLPWWGRHVYAMTTRLAMLPAVAAIWLVSDTAYFRGSQNPPDGVTRHEDQVRAASIMLGFEMLLMSLAIVLAFIFVSVSEGRAREARSSS